MSLSLATKGVIKGRIDTKGLIMFALQSGSPVLLREIIRLTSFITLLVQMESCLDECN